jgi:outer membrane protein TolC
MHYLKQLTLITGLALSSLCLAADEASVPYTEDMSLSSLTEAVYQRLPGELGEAKFSQLQQANDKVSGALFAEPASANLSLFDDAIGSGDGYQEWEGSVDMPLWLPGQKQARQALSDKIIAQLPAYQANLKLKASGEVRDLIWQVKLAEAALDEATIVWQTAKKLEQDVTSRVNAGDLPATERLLASSNTLEADSKRVEAQSNLEQQLKTYRLITGKDRLPASVSEALAKADTIPAAHPNLAMQDQVIERLQSELSVASYQGRVNPSLSLGVRRDRGDRQESYTNSVGVGVSIALDDKRYSEPAIAEASAAMADAQVARQQLQRDLNRQLLVSQQELAKTRRQLDMVKAQDETTQQYYKLQKRAFDLGELNLVDLLRSQVLANQSRSRKRQLEVLIEQKTAQVNQALGLIL